VVLFCPFITEGVQLKMAISAYSNFFTITGLEIVRNYSSVT